MKKPEIIEKIKGQIIPIIRAFSTAEAEKMIETVLAAGYKVLEITMTTPDAVGLIKKLCENRESQIIIGAGTILDAETAQNCVEAGAKFIVSPIFESETTEICRHTEVVFMPGALTPTEIYAAWKSGADAVKVFPVSAMGGVNYIKALKSVFPQISLLPTGGVSMDNAEEFMRAGAVAVGIGSGFEQLKIIHNTNHHLAEQRKRASD